MTRFTRSVTGSPQFSAGGALKTTMSPMLIVPHVTDSLFTMMRSPICKVGSMEPDGM